MNRTDDLGKLVLRLTVGILILLHGIAKLSTGVGGIAGMLAGHGLPQQLAYGVYIGEIVAPVLLIVGFYTRPAAWIVVINMLVAHLAGAHEGPGRARQDRRLGAGTAGPVPVRRGGHRASGRWTFQPRREPAAELTRSANRAWPSRLGPALAG